MSSSPPPVGPPPPGGDVDRGPGLIAYFWVLSAASVTLLSARFYARTSIRAVGWDDWLMLITVVLFVILTTFVTYFASIGGARHVYYLTPQQQLEAVKWSWISQPWAIFLYAPGKASVALLILRFMGPRRDIRKWILYFSIVTVTIIQILGCIITFAQCNPPRALWTPSLPASCWDPSVQANFNYFLTAWNMLIDIVLAILPATIFWNLKMKLAKKISLSILLGLGFVDALFSGIKILYLTDLTQRADFTWSAYNIEVFTGAEAFVMILVGNIPPLKPLWDRFMGKRMGSTTGGRIPLKDSGYSGGSSNKYSTNKSKSSTTNVSTRYIATQDSDDRPYTKNIQATTDIEISSASAHSTRNMV